VRKRNPPPTDPPEFFLDRGLGKRVAEALEGAGWTIHAMFKVFPRSENRRVEDVTWIPRVTDYGWIILAKDSFKLRHERREIVRCGARVFTLAHANMRAAEMAQRFLDNYDRIVQAAAAGGPCHYSVGEDRLRRKELLT
jgi:PIN like domain